MSNLVVVVLWFFWSYRMILKKELYLQVPSIIRTSFKFGLNRLQIKSANSMQTRHTVLYSWHNHVYRWFIPLFIGFIGFPTIRLVVQDFFRNHPQYHCIRKKYCLEIRIIRFNKVPPIPILIIFHHFFPWNYGSLAMGIPKSASSMSRGPKTAALDTRTCSDLRRKPWDQSCLDFFMGKTMGFFPWKNPWMIA